MADPQFTSFVNALLAGFDTVDNAGEHTHSPSALPNLGVRSLLGRLYIHRGYHVTKGATAGQYSLAAVDGDHPRLWPLSRHLWSYAARECLWIFAACIRCEWSLAGDVARGSAGGACQGKAYDDEDAHGDSDP